MISRQGTYALPPIAKARSRPAYRVGPALGALSGLVLPVYWLGESVTFKPTAVIVIGASIVVWALISPMNWRAGGTYWRLASFVLAYFYLSSLALSAGDSEIGVNQIYPVLFLLLCYRTLEGANLFFAFLLVSLIGVVLFGWFRFATGVGGIPSEYMVGYWGIKYTPSTRNSDALAPLALTAIALSRITLRRGAMRNVEVIFLGLCIAIGAISVVLTYSRSAWLALIMFVFLVGGLRWHRIWRYGAVLIYLGLLLALVGFAFADPDLSDRYSESLTNRWSSIFSSDIASSNVERSRLVGYALHVGTDNPLLGVGPGKFDCCFGTYGYQDLLGAGHSENLFLDLFVSHGIFCAASALALFLMAGMQGIRSQQPIQQLCGAGILSITLWLQFNSEISSLLVWVLLGVLCSTVISRAAWTSRPQS